jgi:hypothetical protein
MSLNLDTQRTIEKSLADDYHFTWMETFLIDRKANGLAIGALRFYRIKLKMFAECCDAQTFGKRQHFYTRDVHPCFFLHVIRERCVPNSMCPIFK